MDVECFKQQFLPCHEKLYRIAFRLLGNREDAEDMLQEVYLKLWNKRNSLETIVNAEAYAVGILKNVCFDFLRSSGQNTFSRELKQILGECAGDSLVKQLELEDEACQIKMLINLLPEQQRKVMWLRDVNDCSFEEIEQETGLNAVNIRVALSRARKRIREQFNRISNHENR